MVFSGNEPLRVELKGFRVRPGVMCEFPAT